MRSSICGDRSAHPIDVLDVGGGQLALMCTKLWDDRGVAADLPGSHMSYMAEHGVETFDWNLCKAEAPFTNKFDFAFFVEVIEHLPIPGHVALERRRRVLRLDGVVIWTMPNLCRLRDVVFMAMGRAIFDYCRYPDENVAIIHVLEYSRDHLDWQINKAGFTRCRGEYSQMHHSPPNPLHRQQFGRTRIRAGRHQLSA